MEDMTRETYALTKARYEALVPGDAHRLFRMIETAYRLAVMAHDGGVEMATESSGPNEEGVVMTYVLWSHESLVLSVYVQAVRQTLADLCGR